MERPYGNENEVPEVRPTQDRRSAQIRSRCLDLLWKAEQGDEGAPLMDAATAMAHHALAILWTDDLKSSVRLHRDFYEMLQRAYECTELVRVGALGPDRAYDERANAGLVLLGKAHEAGHVADPTILAARLLRREGARTMMQPGSDGVRRVWPWLAWLMHDEKPLVPGAPVYSRSPARAVLDHRDPSVRAQDSIAWLEQLLNQNLDRTIDAPLPALLTRWADRCWASDARRDTVKHLLDTFDRRCEAATRAEQALPLSVNAPGRRRWRS